MESLIEKGYISKPYIGVSITDVSEETQSYGLPKGAAVKAVTEGSPAEAAGLQVNDIITHADGNEISGSSALVSYVGQCEIGQTLKLTVFRQVEITIGEQIQSANAQQETQQQQQTNPFGGMFPFGGYGY